MKCPKCGGENGFTYLFTMTTSRAGSWGLDVDEETDVVRTMPVNSVKCIDCGKRIEWDIAHGFESGRTPRAADEGDSQPPIYVFSVRDLSTKKADTKPALHR